MGGVGITSPPFEYLLLRQTPKPWRVEDSLLVVAAMFFVLNDAGGRYEAAQGLIHDVLPPQLAEFLSPLGTDWDAPVVGGDQQQAHQYARGNGRGEQRAAA